MATENNKCNWLLVEWKSGGRDVVYIEAVVSPLNKELKINDQIVVNRLGEPEEAKLEARARERVRLDAMIRQSSRKASPQIAGPSMKREPEEEEPEDFCSSASSWVPSDDEGTLSADSDEIPNNKTQLKRCNRQYSKTTHTTHRATPVIPKSMQKSNIRKMMNRKSSRNIYINKTLAFSNRKSTLQKRKQNIPMSQFEHATKIKDTFKALFKTIRKMKQSIIIKAESLGQAPPAPTPYNETIQILNQTEPVKFRQTVKDVREEEEINSDHTELNRSGDNVLTTDKFVNAAVKTVQNKMPEDSEWVPIGSGKTLIHKDNFKKVKWESYTLVTRTLLLAVFSRRVLATHSLTGKKSPAFQNKPAKMCLDPKITTDIIYEVMDRFNVKENLVRSIITTKCADECKMWKNNLLKKKSGNKKSQVKNEIYTPNNYNAATAAVGAVDTAAATDTATAAVDAVDTATANVVAADATATTHTAAADVVAADATAATDTAAVDVVAADAAAATYTAAAAAAAVAAAINAADTADAAAADAAAALTAAITLASLIYS